MSILLGIFAAVLGAIIGSFLNVVILRYNTGQSLDGRSSCAACGKPLRWYELIPVLSFLALGGRCSDCRTRISWQYPAVEAATAVLFFFSYAKSIGVSGLTSASAAMFAFYAVAWSLLVVMAAYDLRHKILPDSLTLAFAALSLGGLVATRGYALLHFPGALDLVAGPLFYLPFYILWKISDGKWIGLGDGKLSWGIGWFLGIVGGASAIVIGFWAGAVVAVGAMLLQKAFSSRNKRGRRSRLTMTSEIPFAPFLMLGTLAVFLFSFDVFGLAAFLSLWQR